ncbi:phosphonate metabolism transcriptional regulator PhnF [Mesorhizobium sp. WSM3224]|uniref:phosphonate metabolism transcriptional regulator PhnF n=1 Tax=Mesorhizobium sp. WSM3224 TaxID=1040986 RepID=UPI000483649C|nr:phosphonate metabolism transcriptional regulator PhnF [Mesorhizobium sp. WSM3224]
MLETTGHLWQQIEATLTNEIERGVLPANARLPSSVELAARFGVNRHTVLRALTDLQAKGLVRIERGRGAYAVVNSMEFNLGPQRWFEENLSDNKRRPLRTVIAVAELPAPAEIAAALQIEPDASLARVTLLGEGSGVPLTYGYHYFPLERLRGIADAFRSFGNSPTESLSFTTIFRSVGVQEFRRRTIRVRSTAPAPDQAHFLGISPSMPVLRTEITNVDQDGVPIVHAFTFFASDRIELRMDL